MAESEAIAVDESLYFYTNTYLARYPFNEYLIYPVALPGEVQHLAMIYASDCGGADMFIDRRDVVAVLPGCAPGRGYVVAKATAKPYFLEPAAH